MYSSKFGPGAGALTFPLAESGAPILAVEIDRDLVADLASRAPANVTIVSGDVLETDVLPYLSGLQPRRAAGADPLGRPSAVSGSWATFPITSRRPSVSD
jgi:16S rRNA A1518/A1519 N6-dimethyltransferase RsmA/KsgA/DIM1 with predicted DNA glycosylase/AP lyase activity